MKLIDKAKATIPKSYTYLIKFNIDGEIKYYYGVRYKNVAKNILPQNDLFHYYFTSSKHVKILLQESITPFEIIIHKIFDTAKEACDFEVKFLTKLNVTKRKDFLNQTCKFNNSFPNNKGKKFSKERKEQMSISSSIAQSSEEYRQKRSLVAKERWKDPDFREYMKTKNDNFKNSEYGQNIFKTRNNSFTGKTHNEQTKIKMSNSMKEAAKKRDFTAATKKRKKYYCPICSKSICASNYDRHLINKHNVSKIDITQLPKKEI